MRSGITEEVGLSEDGADGGFLTRWSRRKREAAIPPADPTDPVPTEPAPEPEPPALPPIESLDARSDYAAFLQAGVPEETRRLGLRQAWLTDPAIAEYRSLADYDWDFNQPGYGRLAETAEEVREMVRSVFGPEPAPPAEASEVEEATVPGERPEEPPPASEA
jgi:hypothetical protein